MVTRLVCPAAKRLGALVSFGSVFIHRKIATVFRVLTKTGAVAALFRATLPRASSY